MEWKRGRRVGTIEAGVWRSLRVVMIESIGKVEEKSGRCDRRIGY